jgi:hypothetical protein
MFGVDIWSFVALATLSSVTCACCQPCACITPRINVFRSSPWWCIVPCRLALSAGLQAAVSLIFDIVPPFPPEFIYLEMQQPWLHCLLAQYPSSWWHFWSVLYSIALITLSASRWGNNQAEAGGKWRGRLPQHTFIGNMIVQILPAAGWFCGCGCRLVIPVVRSDDLRFSFLW